MALLDCGPPFPPKPTSSLRERLSIHPFLLASFLAYCHSSLSHTAKSHSYLIPERVKHQRPLPRGHRRAAQVLHELLIAEAVTAEGNRGTRLNQGGRSLGG